MVVKIEREDNKQNGEQMEKKIENGMSKSYV